MAQTPAKVALWWLHLALDGVSGSPEASPSQSSVRATLAGNARGWFRQNRVYVAKVSTMPCADMPVRTETRASRAAGDASARRMYGTSATTPPLVRSCAVDESVSAGAGAGAAAWSSVLGWAPCWNRFTAGRGEAALAEPNRAATRTRTEKLRILSAMSQCRDCDQSHHLDETRHRNRSRKVIGHALSWPFLCTLRCLVSSRWYDWSQIPHLRQND